MLRTLCVIICFVGYFYREKPQVTLSRTAFHNCPRPFPAALLSRDACRYLSRVCALLFQPALVLSSTGATLSFSDLRDSWQLVVAGALTIVLSVGVAVAFERLLLGPESRRAFRPIRMAIAFQNSAAVPLLLMESLCEQDSVKR